MTGKIAIPERVKKTPEDIKKAGKRGTVYVYWKGPRKAVRLLSGGGQSMLIRANKVYEVDMRNPIFTSWRMKRYYVHLKKPKVTGTVETVGKKVTARTGDNKATTLKLTR